MNTESDLDFEDDFHSTRSVDGSDDEYVNESGSGAEDEDDEEEVETKPKLKGNSSSSSQLKKKLPVKGWRYYLCFNYLFLNWYLILIL